MYIANTWGRAIVDRIVERVSMQKPLIKYFKEKPDDANNKIPDKDKKDMDKVEEFIINPNINYESFSTLIRKQVRDILKFDAGVFEIVNGMNTKIGKTVELYSVRGDNVKLNVNKYGMFNEMAYQQVNDYNRVVAEWPAKDIIYTMANPQSNRVYGLSPLESLVQTVTAELYSSNYNLQFFYNNATPRFAVLMEGLGQGQGNAALVRFREWWNSELLGQPHKPIILGTEQGKITFQNVGLSNKEMEFQLYSKWLLIKIMAVYKMQPALLSIADNTINAIDYKSQERMFKTDAMYPLLKMNSDEFNKRIIWDEEKGFGSKNVYIEFDLDLGDRKEQAEIDERYARMGAVTINEIRESLGRVPVYWGNVPYLQNNLVPFGAGPSGNVVPGEQDNDEGKPVPNLANADKKTIMKYIENYKGNPVGWEDMEPNEKMELIIKLFKEKEIKMRKLYSFANQK